MPSRNSRAGSLGLLGFVPIMDAELCENARCSGTGGRGDCRAVLIYDKMSKNVSRPLWDIRCVTTSRARAPWVGEGAADVSPPSPRFPLALGWGRG